MEKLKYGMVGGGPGSFIGDAHRRSINLDGMAELVAGVFSRTKEKSLCTAKEYGVDPSRCYDNFEEMAEKEASRDDGIDFAVIVTPNVTHYEACKAFLKKGINVSCDKPLCFTSEQARELVELSKKNNCLFMVTYTYTGNVAVKSIRDYIRAGKLGKIRTVMAEYPQGWLAKEGEWGGKQGEWRSDPKQSGETNCLGDLGTHVENIVTEMTGLRIKRLLAKMDVVVPGRVLDDNDFVMIEYEGGANGLYWASQYAIGSDNSLRIRIYGDKGTIKWFEEDCNNYQLITEDNTMMEIHRGNPGISENAAKYARLPSGHPEGWLEAMGNLYRNFITCINAKKDGTFCDTMIDYQTVEKGAEGIQFIEKCLDSNRKGNVWVDF